MNGRRCRSHSDGHGFTLIELMAVVTIMAILVATSIPAYATFVRNARLLAAEIKLTNALKSFSVEMEYSPATDMLADLVAENFLDTIPNDPWTGAAAGPDTGAAEAADWYYENDGNHLYLYARSHPGRLYILPSFGLPPLAALPDSSQTPDTSTGTTTNRDNRRGSHRRGH